MPIYEYKCSSCGHQQEYLQKVSDPPHTKCPACGKEALTKMVTAAGFQLKGSGWYATDFKGKGSSKPADGAKADSKPETKPEAKADAPKASGPSTTGGGPSGG